MRRQGQTILGDETRETWLNREEDRGPMVWRPSLRGDGRDVRDAAEQRYGVRYDLLIARI